MSASALRPSTVGDILDQAFTLYRQNFITLVGIVAVVHVPLLILQVAGSLLFGTQLLNRNGSFAFTQTQSLATLAGIGALVLSAIIAGIASIFETSALSVVISERLLGNSINLRQAYRRALSRWKALLLMIAVVFGATLVVLLFIFIPVVILLAVAGAFSGTGSAASAGASLLAAFFVCLSCVAFPVLLIAWYALSVRLLFAPQAIVLENMGGIDGLRRSWRLVQGSFWRVLGITLLLSILVAIIGQGPSYAIAIVANLLPSPVLGLGINAAASSLINIIVLPLQYAAITLLYYDLRIRKEGFDLEMKAQQLIPSLSGLATDGAGGISLA